MTMGIAAYNRGSRVVARDADLRAPVSIARNERQVLKDENARLCDQVARLERELGRARRCLAAERYANHKRVNELKAELKAAAFSSAILCRLAFPQDAARAVEG